MTRRSLIPRLALALVLTVASASLARAEDGYDLWLRYNRIDDAALLAGYRTTVTSRKEPAGSAEVP